VAPVIRALAGLPAAEVERVAAVLPLRITSERGRTEFMMVSLARREDGGLAAYPIAKGSGAVTAFSQADGFITIGQHQESLAAGTSVEVQLIGNSRQLADLAIIGSHCIGLDVITARLQDGGDLGQAAQCRQHGRAGRCQARGMRHRAPSISWIRRPGRTTVPC
jgi:Molybdopterin biosynthesis enzyme